VPDDPDAGQALETLETPADLGLIWRAVAEDVERARPFIQGDVFDGVVLPGFDEGPGLAMIVDHPCSMRRGAELRERVQMIRVMESRELPKKGWPTKGMYRLMPLPGLLPSGRYAAFFDETGMVQRGALTPERRIACLSEYGVLVLQQRFVHHLTRVVMRLRTLREASITILEEVDLQEDWGAELLASAEGNSLEEALAREASAFDAFMSEPLSNDGISRRNALQDELRRSEVRRSVQREIQRRGKMGTDKDPLT
jgi:hypothetical protein